MKRWACMLAAFAMVGCNEECPSKGKSEGKTPTSQTSLSEGKSVVLTVNDMMCAEGCAKKVEKILASTPGVKSAKVDFDAKEAHLMVEEGAFNAGQTVAELKTAGYPSEVVSTQK
ncbi:heavy-metal-associated domain-containing protein [bacterium]|nr:heavy-metal-associated domain-containing protein [bacterium]